MSNLVRRRLGRSGLALPTALLALTGITVLVAGVFVLTDLGSRATRNRERAARAVQIAEAGVAHTLGTLRRELRGLKNNRLLRGNDTAAGATADDGYLINYTALGAATTA